nr:MAG: hypothetical protein DIU78_10865 [Pseudomonadota bacterium]
MRSIRVAFDSPLLDERAYTQRAVIRRHLDARSRERPVPRGLAPRARVPSRGDRDPFGHLDSPFARRERSIPPSSRDERTCRRAGRHDSFGRFDSGSASARARARAFTHRQWLVRAQRFRASLLSNWMRSDRNAADSEWRFRVRSASSDGGRRWPLVLFSDCGIFQQHGSPFASTSTDR